VPKEFLRASPSLLAENRWRGEELEDRPGQRLKSIHSPGDILEQLRNYLPQDGNSKEAIKTEEWRAQGDDLRTFLGEFVSSLPQGGMLAAFSL
jgi:hypothetical protein